MKLLKMFLDNVQSSEEAIDKLSEEESDDKLCNSYDSESEFEQNDKNGKNSDSENSVFVKYNHTVWQKEKSDQKVKTWSANIISHLSGVKGIARNIKEPIKSSWELFFLTLE